MNRAAENVLVLLLIFVLTVLIGEVIVSRKKEHAPEKTSKSTLPSKLSRRIYDRQNITVLQVVDSLENAQLAFKTAMRSVECYSRAQAYQLRIVEESEFQSQCGGVENNLIRRFCIISNVLSSEAEDYFVYLNADVAVVNFEIQLEQFLDDPNSDLTLSDSYSTWQLSSSTLFIRNSPWSRSFLENFVSFGNDSNLKEHDTRTEGIFHIYLQKCFFRSLSDDVAICERVLESGDIFTFETCFRAILGDIHQFGRVKILTKETSPSRQIWLTDSKWSQETDFMLNGLNEYTRTNYEQRLVSNLIFGAHNWRSPFSSTQYSNCCQDFNPNLMSSKQEIEQLLRVNVLEMEKRKWKSLSKIADFL